MVTLVGEVGRKGVGGMIREFSIFVLVLHSKISTNESNFPTSHQPHSPFIQTWLHTTSDLPFPHRRELFLKAHTVATLKREIDKRSSGGDVDLVLMNLPVMDLCGGVGVGCGGGWVEGGSGGGSGSGVVSGREWVEKGKLRAALCEFYRVVCYF